jgi:uncharacterized protein with ParB-like and HNH nuclease domain
MTIYNILNQIDQREIVLPAIQRDFVWDEKKIYKLLDSIMRGYPIGLVMMWETFEDIQFRHFVQENIPENLPVFHENPGGRKIRLVLDGQQRLQSLYLSLFGKYDGQYLHFDILSGREKDDFEEEKYHFTFISTDQAVKWNEESKRWLLTTPEERDPDFEPGYFVRVDQLFKQDAIEKIRIRKEITSELNLNDEDSLRLEANLARLQEVFLSERSILETSIIDENVPAESPNRQSESDVLEIFVRVNRQLTQLSRSDLIFSMLKLNWRESASDLPQFVNQINKGNSFNLDVDFVIRCLFAVSDLGTKFDVDLLRRRKNINIIRRNYERCCDSIKSAVDTIQEYCWISSSRAVGGYFPIIPMVYYLYNIPNMQLPIDQVQNFRKAFFLFAFSRVFSRYAETRLSKFIREALKPLSEEGSTDFPLAAAIRWVRYWEAIRDFDQDLIQRNHRLAHYLIQGYRGTETQFKPNMQEMDHIFPRSELRKQGKDDVEINNFANFWILSKGKNQNKSNKHPKDFFKDVDDKLMARAYIDRDILNYRLFRRFIRERGEKIERRLYDMIGYTPADFAIELDNNV